MAFNTFRESLGKKIVTWDFVIETIKVSVDVRMLVEGRQIYFRARIRDRGIDLMNTDIVELRDQVEAELKESISFTWEKFYLVKYYKPENVPSAAMLDIRMVEIAKKTSGAYCWKLYGVPEAVPGLPPIGDDGNTCRSLLPATEENHSLLGCLVEDFQKIQLSIYDHLSPLVVDQKFLKEQQELAEFWNKANKRAKDKRNSDGVL